MIIFILVFWGMVGAAVAIKLVMDKVPEIELPLPPHKRIVAWIVCGPAVWTAVGISEGYKHFLKWLKE